MKDTSPEALEELKKQEDELRFRTFTHQQAIALGDAIAAVARERNLPITIDVRAFGQIIYHLAFAGTGPDNDQWVARKSAVVLRFHCSSYRMGRELAAGGETIRERYWVDPMEYSPHGGSFPIRLEGGGVIGAVTVSGLAQEDDHALVVEVLRGNPGIRGAAGASGTPAGASGATA